jgi:outer membrane protein assembly factor BamB
MAVCGIAQAGDWPNWRGPQRNGISAESGWQADFPDDGPKVLWKANAGIGYASVTVANGRAYTTGNKNDQDTVYCWDAATGKPVWQQSYAAPLDDKYYEGGPSATPTVDGDRVYTLGKRGLLHCFDAATGAIRWKKDLAKDLGVKMPTWGFASSVLIDGDRAVVNVGEHGAALDKNTGNVLWKSGTDESGYATPVPFEQNGQKLYLVFAAKAIVAVRADNGQKVWSHKWETSYDVNAADPVVVGPGRVYISSGYDRGGALLDVTGPTPKVLWENKNVRSMLNAGVLLGKHLYAIDGNNGKAQLRCIETESGKVAWTFKDPNHGALMAADGKLIVISEKGELIVGNASPNAFKPIARAQVSGGKFWTVPVLSGGRLYVRNGDGLVTCLDLGAKPLASVH